MSKLEDYRETGSKTTGESAFSNHTMPSTADFRAAQQSGRSTSSDSILPGIQLVSEGPDELTGQLILRPRPNSQHPTLDS